MSRTKGGVLEGVPDTSLCRGVLGVLGFGGVVVISVSCSRESCGVGHVRFLRGRAAALVLGGAGCGGRQLCKAGETVGSEGRNRKTKKGK